MLVLLMMGHHAQESRLGDERKEKQTIDNQVGTGRKKPMSLLNNNC